MPLGATVLGLVGILLFSIGLPAAAVHEWEREARKGQQVPTRRLNR